MIGATMLVFAVLGLFSGNFQLVVFGGLFVLIGLVLVAPVLVKPIANVFGILLAFIFAREGTGELLRKAI